MIRGHKPVKIKDYLMIDRLAEGHGFTKPKPCEQLIGIPAGYIGDGEGPYIEHVIDGKVVASVNCADVSIIRFADDDRPSSLNLGG